MSNTFRTLRPSGVRRPAARRKWALILGATTASLAVACGSDEEEGAPSPEFTAPAPAVSTSRDPIDFSVTEVARRVGIDFWHENGAFGDKWMPETIGSGGGFLDWDGDGWPDILLVNSTTWPGHEREGDRPTSKLFRNLGNGRFEDATLKAGLTQSFYGMGAAFADYDADGDVDVFVTAIGPNHLMENRDGTLVDVGEAMGVTGESGRDSPGWSTASAWIDVDRDGWLDLVVCNYVQWTPETNLHHSFDGVTPGYATPELYEGESCRLYGNRSGRGFVDRTDEAGLLNPDGKALGIAVEDFDDDGWPDFVISNDVAANSLFRNRGDGTFEDIALRAGIAFDEAGRARAGMGIDVADLRGDGTLSIAIGNFADEPLSLFTQITPTLFQDRAGAARLTRPTLRSLTFGLAYADFDLDGHLDLVLANGHIEPTINAVQADVTFPQRPSLFLADGQGRFINASDSIGADFLNEIVGRGLATADYDRDGDIDLLITVNGGPPRLFRNNADPSDQAWIGVRLEGRVPNSGAVGAVVTLFSGERRQRRMVRTGGSFLSQSETNPVLFGLGAGLTPDSIQVRWPTRGDVQTITALTAGRYQTIREGG